MKNRDIEEDEINKITALCPKREKAFFTIMRQSGLAPHIIKQLKIKDAEKILEPDTPIPCKINIQQQKFPTFIGHEAVNYLKQYLHTRRDNLTPESLLFIIRNNPNKEINTKDESRTFSRTAQELKRQRKITYEVTKGKPSELRLFKLRKFYQKKAEDYLAEIDSNRTQKDDEFYRKLYEEKAMPLLEIEPLTPIEIHRLKKQQQELENKLEKIEDLFPKEPEDEYGKWLEEHPEQAKQIEEQCRKDMETHEKWRKEHPEEAKLIDEQIEKENEESDTYFEELYKEHFEEEIKELRNRLIQLENIIKKPKETE